MMEPQLCVTKRAVAFDPGKIRPVANLPHPRNKPEPGTGFWTSTYDGQRSAWIEWCETEGWGAPDPPNLWHGWILRPSPEARILIIDSMTDLLYLHERFGLHSGQYLDGFDFEVLSQSVDGLHLTDDGQWATRLPPVALPNLYGWDCESTLWFRDVFTSHEAIEIQPRFASEVA